MIFEPKIDPHYLPWFAWYPVTLHGPDEWARKCRTGGRARTVWLQTVLRKRQWPATLYALPDDMVKFLVNDEGLTDENGNAIRPK